MTQDIDYLHYIFSQPHILGNGQVPLYIYHSQPEINKSSHWRVGTVGGRGGGEGCAVTKSTGIVFLSGAFLPNGANTKVLKKCIDLNKSEKKAKHFLITSMQHSSLFIRVKNSNIFLRIRLEV